MSNFKDTRSALGHFWPSDKPENRWPGQLSMETFPRARLHCIGVAPGDGKLIEGRLTLHGLTENNEYVTMFEAAAHSGGIAFNRQTATQRVVATANYMLVGSIHYDDSPGVRRLTFASYAAEQVLRLWPRADYGEIQRRRFGGMPFERPVLDEQVASYTDLQRRMRFRIFKRIAPAMTEGPTSIWMVDFLRPVTPKQALRTLHEFRALLALICGDPIDLWNVRFLHKVGEEYSHSWLYFADPVDQPAKGAHFSTLPLLDIAHDRDLFRRVIAHWLAEPQARRMGRGAFYSVLQDSGTLRFSHHRELMTIIEMQESSDGTAPLSKTESRALRKTLKCALRLFSSVSKGSESWRETIEKRIDNINYHDARIQLARYISQLPNGLVSLPATFARDVVEFRNILVHDISRLTSDDSDKLAFFVAKLKAAYAIYDAMALGAKPNEIRGGSAFLLKAKYTTPNSFSQGLSSAGDAVDPVNAHPDPE